jgi:hypothetical protein
MFPTTDHGSLHSVPHLSRTNHVKPCIKASSAKQGVTKTMHIFALLLLCSHVAAFAQGVAIDTTLVALAPPSSLMVTDHVYDNAERLDLVWVPSIDDKLIANKLIEYRVYRVTDSGSAERISVLPAGSNSYSDESVESGHLYSYYVSSVGSGGEFQSIPSAPIEPQREWLNFHLISLLAICVIIGGSIVFFIETARRGKKLFIRRIAGLEAVDDAVGRATEMGRPILFIPGIQDMDDVGTVAGITILGRVSRVVADFDTKITVPTSRSLVMTAARETIKTAYQTAGRPDKYNDDMSYYITDEQFGYVAAVNGIMVREKPATCFYMGTFYAESLLLAETGNSVGAIQIAGTSNPMQIPFFVVACDFTLIGEELFAASAYLSGEPKQLGSLKGQDVGKGIALAAITIGVITVSGTTVWQIEWMRPIVDILETIFLTR